ncbi:MAG: glutamine synthetase beta-grasp domain-containing protein [Verrucomicrobiales bacterium]
MSKYKLEYLWLDGYQPTANIRGKTKIADFDEFPTLDQLPEWGFDGSSTMQAEGHSSDCILKPVAVYPDAGRSGNAALVMCEVYLPDGTPHPSNSRANIPDDPGAWFGFEQEYFLFQEGRPLGWPSAGYPNPQGEYYTGVGYKVVGDVAREIVDEHLDLCIAAGINHEGINAEVAKGQWEFRSSEKEGGADTLTRCGSPATCSSGPAKNTRSMSGSCTKKPFTGDWNGSGDAHCNFSTDKMRNEGGGKHFKALMDAFDKFRDEHIAVYGPDNDKRLTGLHGKQCDQQVQLGHRRRGASIRVPHSFVNNGYKGYLEDRRPNSQATPTRSPREILQNFVATVG